MIKGGGGGRKITINMEIEYDWEDCLIATDEWKRMVSRRTLDGWRMVNASVTENLAAYVFWERVKEPVKVSDYEEDYMRSIWERFGGQYKSLKVLLYLREEIERSIGGDPDRIRGLLDAAEIVYNKKNEKE